MGLKKIELYSSLLQLNATKSDGEQVGLLNENISLGLKRKLQKITNEIAGFYEEYIKDRKEVETKCKDDAEKLKAELEILNNEVVELTSEKASLAMIEEIKSKYNYDFSLIEKFTA